MSRRGATLIEAIIAAVLVAVAAAGMSLVFPRASKSMVVNRRRLIASQMALDVMSHVKKNPYATISVSDETTANFPKSGIGPTANKCNCMKEDMSKFQVQSTQVVDNINYIARECVNYLSPATKNTYCPSAAGSAELGLKKIRIAVFWTQGPDTLSAEADSLIPDQ